MIRAKERFRKIEAMQADLAKLVRTHEVDLLDMVLQFVLDNVEFEGGAFKNNAGNIAKLSGLNAIWKQFKDNQGEDFLSQFKNDMAEISKFNSRYFEQFIAQNSLERLETIALNKELKLLGFTGDSTKVKTGSFLHGFVKSDQPINIVKAEITRLAAARAPRKDAARILRTLIRGDKERLGVLESHQYRVINDTYQRVEAGISQEIATRQGYEFYQYNGGRMTTSRQWCIDHMGKILHTSEIEDWKNKKWQGKITKGYYDPFRDRGGYNCQHNFNPLPTEEARKLGKDVDKFITK